MTKESTRFRNWLFKMKNLKNFYKKTPPCSRTWTVITVKRQYYGDDIRKNSEWKGMNKLFKPKFNQTLKKIVLGLSRNIVWVIKYTIIHGLDLCRLINFTKRKLPCTTKFRCYTYNLTNNEEQITKITKGTYLDLLYQSIHRSVSIMEYSSIHMKVKVKSRCSKNEL